MQEPSKLKVRLRSKGGGSFVTVRAFVGGRRLGRRWS